MDQPQKTNPLAPRPLAVAVRFACREIGHQWRIANQPAPKLK